MGALLGTADRIIGRIAALQHGVVTRAQLLSAGVSRRSIAHRLDKGSLIRVHPGIYRVGHRAPNILATFIAAVYACGDGAALSGRAAGHLLGIVRAVPEEPEVTAPRRRTADGVATRRSQTIEATTWHNIPVTTVARTLVDLAASLTPGELARAMHEAGIRHGTTPEQVEAVLSRHAPQ
jgi:predicted transcriptional regulator of viral defense system